MQYTVTSGDTLTAIANQYGLDLNTLKNNNPQIENANRIEIGDTIQIPFETYTVKNGDTIKTIAQKQGFSDSLRFWKGCLALNPELAKTRNQLSKLYPQDQIKIPVQNQNQNLEMTYAPKNFDRFATSPTSYTEEIFSSYEQECDTEYDFMIADETCDGETTNYVNDSYTTDGSIETCETEPYSDDFPSTNLYPSTAIDDEELIYEYDDDNSCEDEPVIQQNNAVDQLEDLPIQMEKPLANATTFEVFDYMMHSDYISQIVFKSSHVNLFSYLSNHTDDLKILSEKISQDFGKHNGQLFSQLVQEGISDSNEILKFAKLSDQFHSKIINNLEKGLKQAKSIEEKTTLILNSFKNLYPMEIWGAENQDYVSIALENLNHQNTNICGNCNVMTTLVAYLLERENISTKYNYGRSPNGGSHVWLSVKALKGEWLPIENTYLGIAKNPEDYTLNSSTEGISSLGYNSKAYEILSTKDYERFDEAKAYLEKAIQIDPQNSNAYENLIRLETLLVNHEITLLGGSSNMSKENAQKLVAHYDKAISYGKKGIEKFPNNYTLQTLLIHTCFNRESITRNSAKPVGMISLLNYLCQKEESASDFKEIFDSNFRTYKVLQSNNRITSENRKTKHQTNILLSLVQTVNWLNKTNSDLPLEYWKAIKTILNENLGFFQQADRSMLAFIDSKVDQANTAIDICSQKIDSIETEEIAIAENFDTGEIINLK